MSVAVYYFHLTNHSNLIDNEGTDLADLASAREHAIGVAQELTFKSEGKWSDRTMSVCDEHDTELFSLRLADFCNKIGT